MVVGHTCRLQFAMGYYNRKEGTYNLLLKLPKQTLNPTPYTLHPKP